MIPVETTANNQHQLPMMWIGNLQDKLPPQTLSFFVGFTVENIFYEESKKKKITIFFTLFKFLYKNLNFSTIDCRKQFL
jgi:hypothetical protein